MELSEIFGGEGKWGMNTDMQGLILTLANPSVDLNEKRRIWKVWKDTFYNKDEVLQFVFDDGGESYLRVMCRVDYKEFYDIAMELDLANIPNVCYYLFWILNYGHNGYTKLVKDAYEYDPETIKALLPCIEELLFNK